MWRQVPDWGLLVDLFYDKYWPKLDFSGVNFNPNAGGEDLYHNGVKMKIWNLKPNFCP